MEKIHKTTAYIFVMMVVSVSSSFSLYHGNRTGQIKTGQHRAIQGKY